MCKIEKSLDSFSKCKSNKDGLMWYCKSCAKIKRQERYRANLEQEREANRQWHVENQPWKNPVKREYHNAWRRGSDRQTEKQNRRALEMQAEGTFSTEEWYDLCERYGNKCLSCGRPDAKLTQDHVIPLSMGGTNYISNIQPLCGPCNSSKGAKTIDYR